MNDHSPAELIFYETAEGKVRVEVHHEDETFWLSINQMAALFGVDKSGISRHLKNIFEGGELTKEAVVAKFATTADDGKTYQVDYYNLDAIISVGYRVNSSQATRFRIWATNTLIGRAENYAFSTSSNAPARTSQLNRTCESSISGWVARAAMTAPSPPRVPKSS